MAGSRHQKIILIKRFLGFIKQIETSKKVLPYFLLQTVKADCRSTTGSNLRNILLLTSKDDIDKLVPTDAFEIEYEPVCEENEWKINLAMELIDIKHGDATLEQFSSLEVEDILEHICTV